MLAHEKLEPLWIEFLVLPARIGGAVPRDKSILLEQLKRAALFIPHSDKDVQMSRCEKSLTSTSTSTACDGHLNVI